MRKTKFKINGIPTVLYGEQSEKIYLYIHGKHGYKEEAEEFAEVICSKGYQVISIDLPEHGERQAETGSFVPWIVQPELKTIMNYLKNNLNSISIRATSIGAWFSLISFADEIIDKCLFLQL